MNDLSHIFKAYDIRGKVGSELSNAVAYRVGYALGRWLKEDGAVAVGRDMRPDSSDLAGSLIKGLTDSGRDVWDIGEVTSDMIYFAVGNNGLASGAMVTASHNPGDDNGIKLCAEEAKPISLEAGLDEIRDFALSDEEPKLSNTLGIVSEHDLKQDWVNHVLSFIDPSKLSPLRLAVDAGNGMAGAIFPTLEKYVPWEVTEMYFELDGTFPNHLANPLKFETLKDIIGVIKSKELDGGIAFDGDGDRALLIDETGEVLTGGVMSALMAEYFLRKHPGSSIVHDVRNSRSVPNTVEANGGKSIISRVGHSLIKQKMREHDAPFGGEASGHFYFRDNWYADSGIIGAVIALYAATLDGLKLSEVRDKYTHLAAIPEMNFEVEDKEAAISRLAEKFRNVSQNTLDGLTVDFGRAWFNVRASNTEPLLRLNAEAETKPDLDRLVNQIIEVIKL